jgi:hypothetical protein
MRFVRSWRVQGRISRILGLATLIPFLGVSLATPAFADLITASGSAFGEQVKVTTSVGTVSSGPLPTITAPPGGTASLATVNVPGLLQTNLLNVSSSATTGSTGSVSSAASAANVTVGTGVISVSALTSQCHIDSTGHQSGGATIATVTVGGKTLNVSNAPNTTVPLQNVGTAIFNEQITSTTSITVNALRIHFAGILGNGDIIISQSVCSATASGVQVPAGALGGVLLTGLVALAFTGYQRRSRLGW